jgi:hypothetical protein
MGDAVCRQCGEIFAVRVDGGCSFLVEHGLNNVADRGASIGVAPGLRDPVAALEGPVTGPGKIFGAFYGGMGAHGYTEEEYFAQGMARSYKPVAPLSEDSRWQVVPDGSASYKTRVIVHLPKDPDRFNGILLCEWTNVSTFNDISNAVNERFHASGYAYAAI